MPRHLRLSGITVYPKGSGWGLRNLLRFPRLIYKKTMGTARLSEGTLILRIIFLQKNLHLKSTLEGCLVRASIRLVLGVRFSMVGVHHNPQQIQSQATVPIPHGRLLPR